MGSKYHLYIAISRNVVGKYARDNPERYCEWFWVLCSLKKFEIMAREAMDVCLLVLKKATKVGSIASASGTVYWSYRHITFQDCRVHNLYRNSCISIALTIEKKLACWPAIFFSLNSSLMMSLGAGALKVSGGPNAISREEVSMATLEAGTTPRAATNRHRYTE